MKRLLAALFLVLPVFARVRLVRHPSAGPAAPTIPAPVNVMWIGAHPDDESVSAPLLSQWCLDNHATCTFVIATRGEKGDCLLPGGCAPDVGAIRTSEAAAAAAYFNANLLLIGWPDGGGAAPPVWPDDAASTIAIYINHVHPDLVLTFDPRHGTTCHPDHRAIANIALDAVNKAAYRPPVYFLETRVTITPSPFAIDFTQGASGALRFDAASHWNAIVDDMQRHPSQFDSTWTNAIETMPQSERAVYIEPSDSALRENVAGCP